MATGFAIANQCYETKQAADDAYYSAQPIIVFSSPTDQQVAIIYQPTKTGFGGAWVNTFQVADVVGPGYYSQGSTDIIDRTYPTCDFTSPQTDTERFLDGNVLGWGVALAMVAAWAIHTMRRGL